VDCSEIGETEEDSYGYNKQIEQKGNGIL